MALNALLDSFLPQSEKSVGLKKSLKLSESSMRMAPSILTILSLATALTFRSMYVLCVSNQLLLPNQINHYYKKTSNGLKDCSHYADKKCQT